ncbi:MAG: phosphoribosylamine--glycine ligase [Ornithinimicrobium sp.]
MKVLVVGSGAREHALVRSLTQDPDVTAVLAAPGNPGIAAMGGIVEVLPGVKDLLDAGAVVAACRDRDIDLVVIGPEAPLVAGVADAVRQAGFDCFGPSASAAALEGSKSFAKEVMAAADVPTARAQVCTDADQVQDALDFTTAPFVVKDDGLASGKGVVVTDDPQEALAHALRCLDKPGGGRVVIEDYLDGPEVSLFCLSDGHCVRPLVPAQDFKRLSDGGTGPNTGGMGAYTPLPWLDELMPDFVDTVIQRIAAPTVAEMARRGTPFVGVLYVGLALTEAGPRVVEFNARFGDPEVQSVLARLRTPLGRLLRAAATGVLAEAPPLSWREEAAVTVVLAAPGYPQSPVTGLPVLGIAEAEQVRGVHVLQAGTALAEGSEHDGSTDGSGVLSAGGRVLSVVGVGEDLAQAHSRAYDAIDRIQMQGAHYRRDIAADAIAPAASSPTMQVEGHVPLYAGKVRELFVPLDPQTQLPQQERMLLVASDRISAYDHVLSTPVPDKGVVLTQLSVWWLAQLGELCADHLESTSVPAAVQGRGVYVHRLAMLPVECVARAYLTGGGLREYRSTGAVSGVVLPEGLEDGSRLPEPIFTPSTKAVAGEHDAPMTFEELTELIGPSLAEAVRDLTLAILSRGSQIAEERGIIIADTKLEFGIVPSECPSHSVREDGSIDWSQIEAGQVRLILADEVLTPDSSRFWRTAEWEPGHPQKSYDKQFLRDWLTSDDSGWDRDSTDPPPPLPEEVIARTRERYVEAYEALTGEVFDPRGA